MIPFEAIIVAALTFGSKLIDYADTHREGMSQENRDRWDALQLAGLERVERILSALEVRR